MFERYYQADLAINRAGGLGLGLYVSRAIVEAHGGTIAVESAPDAGALLPRDTAVRVGVVGSRHVGSGRRQ